MPSSDRCWYLGPLSGPIFCASPVVALVIRAVFPRLLCWKPSERRGGNWDNKTSCFVHTVVTYYDRVRMNRFLSLLRLRSTRSCNGGLKRHKTPFFELGCSGLQQCEPAFTCIRIFLNLHILQHIQLTFYNKQSDGPGNAKNLTYITLRLTKFLVGEVRQIASDCLIQIAEMISS